MRGRVRARAGDDRGPVADLVHRRGVELQPLLVGEVRALACGAGDHEPVGAVIDQVARERAEPVEVDGPVGAEGGDHRRQDLAQHGS